MSSIAQNIPEDVICEVFTHFPVRLDVVGSGCFPWYLGHICSKWRVAFLSTPQFWNYNRICGNTISVHDQRKMKRITDIVTFFLEQNPGCPFDLQYYSCNPFHPELVSKVSPLHWVVTCYLVTQTVTIAHSTEPTTYVAGMTPGLSDTAVSLRMN